MKYSGQIRYLTLGRDEEFRLIRNRAIAKLGAGGWRV